jgi:hypothetical protein
MGAGGRASTSVARPPRAIEDPGYDVVRLAVLARPVAAQPIRPAVPRHAPLASPMGAMTAVAGSLPPVSNQNGGYASVINEVYAATRNTHRFRPRMKS